MKNTALNLLAAVLARPAVVRWLVRLAERTPYTNITSPQTGELYMWRAWLFNRYDRGSRRDDGSYAKGARWKWLPSIRLHRIMQADDDRHLHDHPWNARTFILDGWYIEEREDGKVRLREAGQTSALNFGEYHRIHAVSPGGVLTLFVTFKHCGTWGFLVDGKKVPWREYLSQ